MIDVNFTHPAIIFDLFQGLMKVSNQKFETIQGKLLDRGWEMKNQSFLLLTLDLPQMSLFKEDSGQSTVPQESLENLLSKYNNKTQTRQQPSQPSSDTQAVMSTYQLLSLPPLLILSVRRLLKNNYFLEKHPAQLLLPPGGRLSLEGQAYRLRASIIHEGLPAQGSYHACLDLSPGAGPPRWVDVADMYVRDLPEGGLLSQPSYLLLFEKEKPEEGAQEPGKEKYSVKKDLEKNKIK